MTYQHSVCFHFLYSWESEKAIKLQQDVRLTIAEQETSALSLHFHSVLIYLPCVSTLECKKIVRWCFRGDFLSSYSTSCRANYLIFSLILFHLISYAFFFPLRHIKPQTTNVETLGWIFFLFFIQNGLSFMYN